MKNEKSIKIYAWEIDSLEFLYIYEERELLNN